MTADPRDLARLWCRDNLCVYIHKFGGAMGRHRNLRPREVAKMLTANDWAIKRKGPGDHVQYVHPSRPGKVTLHMGADPIPAGTLRSIYRQAGWDW